MIVRLELLLCLVAAQGFSTHGVVPVQPGWKLTTVTPSSASGGTRARLGARGRARVWARARARAGARAMARG